MGPDPICGALAHIEGDDGTRLPIRCNLSAYHRRPHSAIIGLLRPDGKPQRVRWAGRGPMTGDYPTRAIRTR